MVSNYYHATYDFLTFKYIVIMKVKQLFLPFLLLATGFYFASCNKDVQNEETTLLTAEEEVLYQHALLEGSVFRTQTATRFFLDAAQQRIYLNDDKAFMTANPDYRVVSDEERLQLEKQITDWQVKDDRYAERLEGIFEKVGNIDNGNLLFRNQSDLKVCPCPPELFSNSHYCEWKETALIPILVDTDIYNVQQITIEDQNTQALIATSESTNSTIEAFPNSSYVLYKLAKVDSAPIPVGTVVVFIVNWVDENQQEQETELLIEVAE